MNRLLPCPECLYEQPELMDDGEAAYVECPECGFQGLPCLADHEAVVSWNLIEMRPSSLPTAIEFDP